MEKSESINHFKFTKFFANKKVILTGATGGIGSQILIDLLECGAKVMAFIRNEQKLKSKNALSNYIKTEQLLYTIVDFSLPLQINKAVSDTLVKFQGELDIIIMSHGIFIPGDMCGVSGVSVPEYDNSLNVNVRSCFHLLSICIPFLKLKTKSSVVILSSVESKVIEKGCFLHSLSKTLLNSMVQCSALELAPFGIRVNAVAPSFVNTKYRVGKEFSEIDNEKILSQMGDFGLLNEEPLDPKDVSDAVLFAASDDAAYMTGEIIVVDNGFELNHDLAWKEVEGE